MSDTTLVPLTRKDFQTPNDVRWCPGCGDYAILATMQRFLPSIGIRKENIAFVSGIGCAARFPYYMETYGMHSIHGRGPTVATGLKLVNPDLTVFLITGDGDALSIGGNHMLHLLRRNVDIKVLLFNNRIYGLTKGQTSPASEIGKVTKSTPLGSIDHPVNPAAFAIGAGATFFARTTDVDAKGMTEVFERAVLHKGTALVEILQNCVVFNDGVWDDVTQKASKGLNTVTLKDGAPLVYDEGRKGIALDVHTLAPFVIDLEQEPQRITELLVHRDNDESGTLAHIYSQLLPPTFPMPVGVFRQVARPTYESLMRAQTAKARSSSGDASLEKLLKSGDIWNVA